MSTPSVTQSRDEVRLVTRPAPRMRRRAGAAAARRRLALALIAPAALFMLLVHGLPTLGGLYLSFKELNTFTFVQLFDAPSAGLDNYTAIFDADSPLRSGFFGAVQNTAVYTARHRGRDARRRDGGGAAASTARSAASGSSAR